MEVKAFIFTTILIILSCNVIGFIVSFLPFFLPALNSARIQDKTIHLDHFLKRLPLILLNMVLLCLLSGIALYFFYPMFFDGSLEIHLGKLVGQLLFILFVDDLFFYFLHRYMHTNRKVFKKIHAIHHRASAPFAMDYLYVHPIEWMSGYIGPFIGIILIGCFMPVQIFAFWAYVVIRNIHEIDVHSGFKSKFSNWIPLWGENEHHDKHHEVLDGNYATTFTFWDKIFKTEIPKSNKNKF